MFSKKDVEAVEAALPFIIVGAVLIYLLFGDGATGIFIVFGIIILVAILFVGKKFGGSSPFGKVSDRERFNYEKGKEATREARREKEYEEFKKQNPNYTGNKARDRAKKRARGDRPKKLSDGINLDDA